MSTSDDPSNPPTAALVAEALSLAAGTASNLSPAALLIKGV